MQQLHLLRMRSGSPVYGDVYKRQGGNSVSENVGVKHLINIKTVAERRENMLWMRTPEKVYFKKGCLPVALDELGTVMHLSLIHI